MSRYSQFAAMQADSGWARQLDARVKLAVLLVSSLTVWYVDTYRGLGLTAAVCAVWLWLAGPAAGRVLGGLKRMWTVFVFVIVYYLWAAYSLGGGFGWDGLLAALGDSLMLIVKLAVLVATALWLYHSTPPMKVVDSLTSLLRPLEKLKVPVNELGFTVGLVIRAFPSSLARIRELWSNFRRQGKLAGSGDSFVRRFSRAVRAVVDTMVCYMHYTLHEAELLSLSLQARGYNPFNPPVQTDTAALQITDWLFLTFSCLAVILISIYL